MNKLREKDSFMEISNKDFKACIHLNCSMRSIFFSKCSFSKVQQNKDKHK